jgi:hypothetical protein
MIGLRLEKLLRTKSSITIDWVRKLSFLKNLVKRTTKSLSYFLMLGLRELGPWFLSLMKKKLSNSYKAYSSCSLLAKKAIASSFSEI